MSMDRDVNVNLNVTPDPQLQQKLSQLVSQSSSELKKLGKNNAFQELDDDVKLLTKNTDKATGAVKKLDKAADEAARSASAATQKSTGGGGGGGGGAGGFDKGAAGAKLGAAGAAGGQIAALGGVSGQAGSAISLLGSSIGQLGVAGGALAVTAIAAGAALKVLTNAQEAQRKEVQRQAAAFEDQLNLSKMTTEELEDLHVVRQQEVDDAQALTEEALRVHRAQKKVETQSTLMADNFFVVGDAMGVVGATGDETEKSLNANNDALVTAKAELDNVNDALGSTETAANDAAAALEEQVKANTKSALTNADIAAKTLKFELDAVELSKEANEKRTEQISKQTQVLQKEFDTLTASLTKGGVNTQEVSKRLGVLSGQMNLLNVEAGVLGEAFAGAASEADKLGKGEEATTKKRSSSLRAGFIKIIKEEEGAADERLKIAMDFANAIKDIQFDSDKERQQIAIDANREQSAALRRHAFEIGQDFEQDFLGAFKAQNELAFGLRETQIGAGQSFADVDRSQRQSQQQLRADTPGAQQLIENNQTFNFPGANATLFETILQDSMGVS